jgi:hypothetical protein
VLASSAGRGAPRIWVWPAELVAISATSRSRGALATVRFVAYEPNEQPVKPLTPGTPQLF